MSFRSLLILGVVVGCASHDEDRSPERMHRQCVELTEHMIDLRLETLDAAKDVDAPAHRAALKQAIGTSLAKSCEQTLSPKQVKCVIAAKDLTAANECWPKS
jgi:hypothetical protein